MNTRTDIPVTTSPRRAAALAVVLLALAVLLSLLSGAGWSSAQARGTSSPPLHARVGSCHEMYIQDYAAVTATRAHVPCGRQHDTVTVAERPVRRGVGYDDKRALARVSLRTCFPAVTRTLHTSFRRLSLSAYQFVWFLPTRAQWRTGDRELRCDLVAFAGYELASLPRHVHRLPHGTLPDRLALCRLGRYDTTCSRQHDSRATASVHVPGTSYPSPRRFARVAARRCPASAGPRFEDVPAFRAEWQVGHHLLTCYRPTER